MSVQATYRQTTTGAPRRGAGGTTHGWLSAQAPRVLGRLKLGPYARLTRYGLCRDLLRPFAGPSAKIPISVRKLREQDLEPLFAASLAGNDITERIEAAWRRAFVAKGARNGFVAVDERNGAPCHVQWLFGPDDNDFIRRLGGFPDLEQGQAIVENVYTPPAYRRLGIMSAALAQVAGRATEIDARQVFIFVGTTNWFSLKGCQRAGFSPVMLHHSIRLGFGMIRRDSFQPLDASDPRRSARF
jgi:GNAT superfamily N-acetyltransferase